MEIDGAEKFTSSFVLGTIREELGSWNMEGLRSEFGRGLLSLSCSTLWCSGHLRIASDTSGATNCERMNRETTRFRVLIQSLFFPILYPLRTASHTRFFSLHLLSLSASSLCSYERLSSRTKIRTRCWRSSNGIFSHAPTPPSLFVNLPSKQFFFLSAFSSLSELLLHLLGLELFRCHAKYEYKCICWILYSSALEPSNPMKTWPFFQIAKIFFNRKQHLISLSKLRTAHTLCMYFIRIVFLFFFPRRFIKSIKKLYLKSIHSVSQADILSLN